MNDRTYSTKDRLKQLMKERNLKQIDIINMSKPFQEKFDIKLSKSNMSEYVNGKSSPDQAKIYLLANTLDVSEPWLMGYDVPRERITIKKSISIIDDVSRILKKLEEDRQLNVLNCANAELKEQIDSLKSNSDLTVIYAIEKVAAGTGYSYYCNESTPYYTERNDFVDYDFATLVDGDSMEPKYSDGDIILVKSGYDNVNGDIYVIDYDGKSYVKKLYNDGDRFRLVSINKKYDNIVIDIPIENDIYFNIIGKVVDSFTPIDDYN